MDTPPEHQNCPCGRPLSAHTLPGIWFDDDTGHFFFINCPECSKGLKHYLSPWAMVDKWGLEGAEQMIEEQAKMKWNQGAKCEHIFFQEAYR